MSLLFYKAQRSGVISDTDVKWRSSAFINDRTQDGKDVTGGFFDAGGFVHFMLPQATTLSTLAMGIVEFEKGYKAAGAYTDALQVLRWGTDFLLKCDLGPNRLVGQVGTGVDDHRTWGRPEDITNPYRVYELTPAAPGADVAGAVAAALAASAVVFKSDATYAARCIESAKRVFDFGLQHPGIYSDSISDASGFYKSSSQYDDMSLAAAWLHNATGEAKYLDFAIAMFQKHAAAENGLGRWAGFDWDNQVYAAAVMLKRAAVKDDRVALLLQRQIDS